MEIYTPSTFTQVIQLCNTCTNCIDKFMSLREKKVWIIVQFVYRLKLIYTIRKENHEIETNLKTKIISCNSN